MTFEEKISELLFNSGLFENQVAKIIERAKEHKLCEPMARRWREEVEHYPSSVLTLLWASVKVIALEYIDANCPLAWFRPLFTGVGEENIE